MAPQRPTHHSVIVTSGPAPIDKLRPHPDNPNTGDTEEIAKSLTLNGMYRPIVARTDGTILAGHHVYEAAMSLGWTELHVTFVDVDDATATRIMIADNRLADLGPGVDLGLLMPLLTELQETTEGLAGTGYSEDDMANLASLLDHGVWNPDEEAGSDFTNHEGFWPKIALQVAPETFDAWRSFLDAHDGENDVDKLNAALAAQGFQLKPATSE
jgi:hypothetical protein